MTGGEAKESFTSKDNIGGKIKAKLSAPRGISCPWNQVRQFLCPRTKEPAPQEKATPQPNVFKGYFSLYRYATAPDICLLLLAVLAALLSGVCVPALAVVFAQLINSMVFINILVTRNETNESLCDVPVNASSLENTNMMIAERMKAFLIQFSLLSGIYAGLNVIFFICWSIPAEKQTVRWAREYIKAILAKDMEWFDKHFDVDSSSDVIENICWVRQGIGIQVPMALNLISTFVLCTACVLWWGSQAWIYILVAFTLIPFIGYLQHVTDTVRERDSKAFANSITPVVAFAGQVFTRIQTVLLYNGQRKELHYFKQKQAKHLKMNVGDVFCLSFLHSIMALGINLYLAMVFWEALTLLWDQRSCRIQPAQGLFSVEIVFAIFGCILFGNVNIWLVRSICTSFGKAKLAGSKIAHLMDSTAEFEKDQEIKERALESIKGKIEFEEIQFAYPCNKNNVILTSLSFIVQPGQKAGFVGTSGTGLSTIFKLFLRNYLPDCGFIRLDDEDVRFLNRRWLLGQVGYITHDPLIFNDTIENNVKKGRSKVTSQQVEAACREAEVHDLIFQQPNGYQTVVGEDGESLDQQIRVQIAIARLILQKPSIIILDEPTLSLDWHSSCIIENILDKVCQKVTTLVIPHRFHYIRNADIIFVVSNGVIVEQGTHDMLLGKKGAYYQMINQMDITPSKRLELAKINKVFLGKQILPHFTFPNYGANIGFPDIMGMKTTQIWLESQLATPTFGKNTFEEEPLRLAKSGTKPTAPAPVYKDLVPPTKVDSDVNWKKCAEQEDKCFRDPTAAYSHNDSENDVFCCSSILHLTLSSAPYVVIGMICSFILGILTPMYAGFLGRTVWIFSISDKEEAFQEGKFLAVVMMSLGGVSFVVIFIQTLVFDIGSKKCFIQIQRRLFTSMLRQDFGWFEKSENNNHALQTRLSRDISGVKYLFKSFFGSLTHYIVGVCACIATALLLPNVTFGAAALVFVPLSIGTTFLDAILLTETEESRKKKMKLMRSIITEMCNKRQTIWPSQLQSDFSERLNAVIKSAYTSHNRKMLVYVRAVTFALSQGGVLFLYALFMILGKHFMLEEALTFPQVIEVGHLLLWEMTKIGVVISMLPSILKAFTCGANILKVLTSHPKICLDKGNAKDIKGEIEFRHVHFWYEDVPHVRILNEISFRVKLGRTVALVGVAGSGKSICLQLILRLRDATMGTVAIDGEDTKNLNCVQLRQQIALLSQEPHMTMDDRTIREVIAYGDNTRPVTMTEIMEAAVKANVHLLISSLPHGYDTVIGSAKLSMGQRRRIYLARVFLKNPKVVLIEESPATFDPESSRKIFFSLARLLTGRTCLILAHHVRTAELADYVYVFHKGKIWERGTHSQLLALGGIYKQTYEAQSGKSLLYESTLVRKFDSDAMDGDSGEDVKENPDKLRPSSSLPNLSIMFLAESSQSSLKAKPSISLHQLADKIVDRVATFWDLVFNP